MYILDFADVIDKQIIIRYYPNQQGRFMAQFEGGEIKEGCCLVSHYENGLTPYEALSKYARSISNKKIVFNAMEDCGRQEFIVPQLDYQGE